MRRHNDPETNWAFECVTDSSGSEPPQGGLVLQKVRHDGHNFAKDIRMIGVWIEIEYFHFPDYSGRAVIDRTEGKFVGLGSDWGFTASHIRTLEPESLSPRGGKSPPDTFKYLKETDEALYFSGYFHDARLNSIAYGVAAKYEAPHLFADLGVKNCEYSGLSIEQIFLFSRYSNTPPHEPSGALTAARFHPLVRYEFDRNKDFDGMQPMCARIASIRFDFRLHLYLDSHYDEFINIKLNQFGNQAGLFADRDSVASAGVHAASGGVSGGAFAAVEKPLVLEVTAPGLLKGVSDGGDLPAYDRTPEGQALCWDNVHWWGVRQLGGRPSGTQISAPGAFHAAHIHWRWGGVLQYAPTGLAAGLLQLDPGMPFLRPATPLVDPGIFMQTIRVAVTKNGQRFDPALTPLADLSKRYWEPLFETRNYPPPELIQDGADIVLWYSAEVHRQVTIPSMSSSPFLAALSGTVFVHGIFFAHDAERTSFAVGSTSAEYRPRKPADIKQKGWFRSAD